MIIKVLEKFFDFLASLKLAVLVIIAIGVLSAVGTIYEAQYDAIIAQKLIYKSVWMYVALGGLAINLVAVMVDRWPWKWRHTPFILAHVGIILLLIGSMITQKWGIDGSMSFPIGGSNRHVVVGETDLAVYAGASESLFEQKFSQAVDFITHPPSKTKFVASTGEDQVEVLDYIHFGYREAEVKSSDKLTDGPAIRLQLKNPNVNVTQWLIRSAGQTQVESQLGPAKIVLTRGEYQYQGGNVLVLKESEKGWKYFVYTKSRGGLSAQGSFEEGAKIATGWMGIEATVLRVLPRAREVVKYTDLKGPGKQTRPAILVRYQNEEHWLGLNSVLKLYGQNRMVWISYANRRIDIGFPIQLIRFEMGKYQGTNRASSYQSEVEGEGFGRTLISMNEPLHYKQYTFYQASFEQDPQTGEPVSSILSVNYDPGLWMKYLGSFLIVLGSILLFYFKRQFVMKKKD